MIYSCETTISAYSRVTDTRTHTRAHTNTHALALLPLARAHTPLCRSYHEWALASLRGAGRAGQEGAWKGLKYP